MMQSFTYANAIRALIDSASSRGTVVVRHNRRKYELPSTAAKALADAVWGDASKIAFSPPDPNQDFPVIYVGASQKKARAAMANAKLLAARPSMRSRVRLPRHINPESWVTGGGVNYRWQLNKTGVAIARACFAELTGLDVAVCAAEVARLRTAEDEHAEELRQRIANGLRGMHDAAGKPITAFHQLRSEADRAALADQITALRELAAKGCANST